MVVGMRYSTRKSVTGTVLYSTISVRIKNSNEEKWYLDISVAEVDSLSKALYGARHLNEGEYIDWGSTMLRRRLYKTSDHRLVLTTKPRFGNTLKFSIADPHELRLKLAGLKASEEFKRAYVAVEKRRIQPEEAPEVRRKALSEERNSLKFQRELRSNRVNKTVH